MDTNTTTDNKTQQVTNSRRTEIGPIQSEGDVWFKISNHDSMRPFFMNIVSDSNHWMFISSNGGISAGRKNPEYALFPYYTDDKLQELADTTGSKSIFQIHKNNEIYIWEPFSDRYSDKYQISRNLYKNKFCNKLMFEEINHDLELSFRYQWNTSDAYGFVKKSELRNTSDADCRITLLDGIQNVMPFGIDPDMQMTTSNLADAYKKNELVKESGIGIFALSAIIVDKAEPSEALKANTVWSTGLSNPQYLISSLQLDQFRSKQPVDEEVDIRGEKGAYFVKSEIMLPIKAAKQWKIIAEVNQNHSEIIDLKHSIEQAEDLDSAIQKDIDDGTHKLVELVAGSDGLQLTEDTFKDARHYSNVLYNIMRGGTFDHNYVIEKEDFANYLANANSDVYKNNKAFITQLNKKCNRMELEALLDDIDDPDLTRLAKEYLPLKFSRRHGDPSRPWNQFSINTKDEQDGSKVLDYEGNWRDIFQNWEALVHSYPDFIEGMIHKFLNASTFEGYNPYRVTKRGFDWERIDPDDPWSYIGYWGDHQIIYLLKFLEFYDKYQPESFKKLFDVSCFTYANVPYKIKPYDEIVKDPKNTIDFDDTLDRNLQQKIKNKGSDGALLGSQISEIHHVNFVEKILALVLSKVSNFVPDGGIWMNTQRPEWNDANNALVGNGVSMVTLYYLRRFLSFFDQIISELSIKEVDVSGELLDLFSAITETLENHKHVLDGDQPMDGHHRKAITDALGQSGSDYRNAIYEKGFSGTKQTIAMADLAQFIKITLEFIDQTIENNRRKDHLYHAYNLLSINSDSMEISYLDEMLEGQVAAISSGYLDAGEVVTLLDALRQSDLYREDQNSYILYPNKQLPRFLEKNTIPKDSVESSKLLMQLLEDGNYQIINKDVEGNYHFNGNFKNADDVKDALDALESKSTEYGQLVAKERDQVLTIFEEVFDHKSFTGRSGTFFAYEGLGSIYWHMVSKLRLAVNEVCIDAITKQEDSMTIHCLLTQYYGIVDGIGVHKSPERYGAFPTDAYSHTPQHRGAQQPGMTGQVKEDILSRFGELGIVIHNSRLCFDPRMLKRDEFVSEPQTFEFVNIQKQKEELQIDKNEIGITFCQIPMVYQLGEKNELTVELSDGTFNNINGLSLDASASMQIFKRTGEVKKITISLAESFFRSTEIPPEPNSN